MKYFDENGKSLSESDIIYNFLKKRAEKHRIDIEDIYVGVYLGSPPQKKPSWIYTVKAEDNGYDAINLCEFGGEVMVNPQ